MAWLRRLLRWALVLGLCAVLFGAAAVGFAYWLIAPRLPDVAQIRDIRLQVPLRVMSRDDKLIAVIGEAHRTPAKIAQIPKQLKDAFIAIEDSRFYEHPGIDAVGIVRAVWLLATTDDRRVPGGSTITQQVARNYFLSAEYSYTRKLSEMFLALRLERELTKDEILELYLNKIFFGYRSYGVAAAAEFYYGKTLDQLTLAESAMLASLPKFPSSGNPLSNPDRALERRNYILGRMRELGLVTPDEYKAAVAEPERAHPHEPAIEVEAPHLAEMARQFAIERFGPDALTNGYIIRTTIDTRLQDAANAAVRNGLIAYDKRHGYRGPARHVTLAENAGAADYARELANERAIVGLIPGLVVASNKELAQVWLQDGQTVELGLPAVQWAKPFLSENSRGPAPKDVATVLKPGDVVRLTRDAEGKWLLAQIPAAQAALVSLDPEDGAIRAIVGGLSFTLSKFNRAVQSSRQPGSSFKPLLYSAAFERGFNPASLVNDAPLVFPDPSRPDGFWKPSNDDEKFFGPTRLREALVHSRNLVSVRLLDAVGVGFARNYITRFGLPLAAMPENLSLALGTASVAPLTMARAYAVFANSGYLVEPYFIDRVSDDRGGVLFAAQPARACRDCPERGKAGADAGQASAEELSQLLGLTAKKPEAEAPAPAGADAPAKLAPRVADERNIYLMTSIMRDVVLRGTGHGAMVLKRNDLAGKTGTTNEHRDAWFSGFNDRVVTTVWAGFDDFSSLGKGEFGAEVALPIWIDYMRAATDGMAENPLPVPTGVATARIDPATGQLLDGATTQGIAEFFKADDIPRLLAQRNAAADEHAQDQPATEIF
jgi:penicillin-binding protein 1A